MSAEKIRIDYFNDLLCVWAYVSQIRVNELKQQFGAKVEVNYHFIPVFGCVNKRIGEGWKEKGSYSGFNQHVQSVCHDFSHLDICPGLWEKVVPSSSWTSHHLLKSIQLLEQKAIISPDAETQWNQNSLFEEAMWRVRLAFFKEGRDISQVAELLSIVEQLPLPTDKILEQMNNGEALAALHRDIERRNEYHVEGSPTYVLNNGRQKLYGNVGYKIIEANVREVMETPENRASWC